MPPLRVAARKNAISRLQAGQRQADVAHALNVSQSTISRLWNRFRQSGSTADAPRSGRPRVTTPAQDRFIRLRHLRNRFLSAQSTVQALPSNQRISRQTVRNRIHGAGLRAHRPYQGNVLTRRHRQARMLWANQHRPGLSGTIGDMFGSVTSPDSCCSATTEEDGFTDGVVSDMRLRAWMRRLLMTVVASLFGEPSATQAGVSWFESKAT